MLGEGSEGVWGVRSIVVGAWHRRGGLFLEQKDSFVPGTIRLICAWPRRVRARLKQSESSLAQNPKNEPGSKYTKRCQAHFTETKPATIRKRIVPGTNPNWCTWYKTLILYQVQTLNNLTNPQQINYLIPDIVNPSTIYFWKNEKMMMIGTTMNAAPAICRPKLLAYWPCNSDSPTDRV